MLAMNHFKERTENIDAVFIVLYALVHLVFLDLSF